MIYYFTLCFDLHIGDLILFLFILYAMFFLCDMFFQDVCVIKVYQNLVTVASEEVRSLGNLIICNMRHGE